MRDRNLLVLMAVGQPWVPSGSNSGDNGGGGCDDENDKSLLGLVSTTFTSPMISLLLARTMPPCFFRQVL